MSKVQKKMKIIKPVKGHPMLHWEWGRRRR